MCEERGKSPVDGSGDPMPDCTQLAGRKPDLPKPIIRWKRKKRHQKIILLIMVMQF